MQMRNLYNFMNTRDSGIVDRFGVIWNESDKIEMLHDASNIQTVCLYELRDVGYDDYIHWTHEIYEMYKYLVIQELEQNDMPDMYSGLLEKSTPRTLCIEYDTSQPNYKNMMYLIPIIFRS